MLRIGAILLIIGLLHGVNIVLMPVLGRLFSLNRKLSAEQRDPDPCATREHRRREVGVVEHPGGPRQPGRPREVEPLPADVAAFTSDAGGGLRAHRTEAGVATRHETSKGTSTQTLASPRPASSGRCRKTPSSSSSAVAGGGGRSAFS